MTEAYSELTQTSKLELFGKIVKRFQSTAIFAKSSILDVWVGSKCTSE